MNKYDLNHICTTHPKMSRADWDRAYKMAWQRFFTIEHVETILRRVASTKASPSNALFLLTWFMGSINIEHIHPLESGLLRLKYRRDRRPGLPIAPVWSFYPKYLAETAGKIVKLAALYFRLRRIYLRVKHDPQRYAYTDMVMSAVAADEAETHELFGTDAARAFIARVQHVKDAQHALAHEVMPAEAANRRQPMRASKACARLRCGWSYILPSMPTVPAPGFAANAATTAFAFAICLGLGVNTSLMTATCAG